MMMVYTPTTSKMCNNFYHKVTPYMYNFASSWKDERELTNYIHYLHKKFAHLTAQQSI